jgi:conjugal transfer pilus assembly protein TraF
MKRVLLPVLALTLVLASSGFGSDLYQRERHRGWWWYEDPPKKPEEKPPAALPVPEFTPEQLAEMDPDRLKDYADQVLKEAVRLPSEANVHRHYRVQDVIRRKAMAFTNASEMIWQKYPELSTAKDTPVAAPGRRAVTREQGEERLRILAMARDDFALLYFRSDECPFCQDQDGILSYLQSRIGWEIEPIDIDLAGELATRLGVRTTPSLVLIQKGNPEFFPIATGVTSAEEIENHLFRAVRLLTGTVTPDNFNLYDFQRGGGFDARKNP